MKTRLVLFLIGSILWTAIYRGVLSPASVLTRQAAAVATTANSNTAYIAQTTVESGLSAPWFSVGLTALFLLCFTRPIINACTTKTS